MTQQSSLVLIPMPLMQVTTVVDDVKYLLMEKEVIEKALFPDITWECKDYADGWIPFSTLTEALLYQEQTGCIMRPVRNTGVAE